MARILLITSIIIVLSLQSFGQKEAVKTIPDGLYLVVKVDSTAEQVDTLSRNELPVSYSEFFEEYNSDRYLRLILDTTEYVPLELEKAPTTEQQTKTKKKLLLSLTEEASNKLHLFTTRQLMNNVALVVDGEALTMHKIKEAITSGQLQITRCSDNACERLYVTLKDNIQEEGK